MGQHHKAKLGPAGRAQLVSVINAGATFRAAAAVMNVAPATAHRWWWRWQHASETERCSGRWSFDRSSRPHRSPRQTPPGIETRICQARERTNLGPGRLAGLLNTPRSTVHAVLSRHGLSRRRRGQRQTFRRYEWSEPGALLHMDVKRLARFGTPGSLGDRPLPTAPPKQRRWLGLSARRDRRSQPLPLRRAARPRRRSHQRQHPNPRSGALRRARSQSPRSSDDRQRAGLHPLRSLQSDPRQDRLQTHHPAALHTPLERESRKSHTHPPRRMGLRPSMAILPTPHQSSEIIHPLLQPQATTQQPRRPTTHQPRSQRPWSGHLDLQVACYRNSWKEHIIG
jgi:hypothetical protein